MINKQQNNKIQYGNWVSQKLLTKVTIAAIFTSCISILLFLLPKSSNVILTIFRVLSIALFIFFLFSLIYFLIARKMFSYTGGKIQEKVINKLINTISWNGIGKALDIGCGSGYLTITLAKEYESASITGIDYWGDNWDYCKKQCEENARLSGVNDRTEFIKSSASKLPFEDGTFDLVVSNMTFHEVADSDNKIEPVLESLRVLKKGSTFVLQDLFMIKKYFGTTDELLNKLREAGIAEVNYINTSECDFIPGFLKLSFMLGAAGIIYGKK